MLEDVQTVGERVKRLMGLNCLTQKNVADMLGCSRSLVSQKCAGKITFSVDEIGKLSNALGVSADVLLGREPLEVS